MPINVTRHEQTVSKAARGAAAMMEPRLPISNVRPLIKPKMLSLNQMELFFMILTNTTDTPTPTIKRPRQAMAKVSAKPNRMDPIPASRLPAMMAVRVPKVSDRTPEGTCMAA